MPLLRKELPKRFQTVMMIRSAELRNKLSQRIIIIINLLIFLEAFELGSRTTELVDRYFDYLNNSCESPQKLNERARWLVDYADIIQDHLLAFQDKYDKQDGHVTAVDNGDLTRHITKLIDATSLYRIRVQGSHQIDLDILQLLCFMLDQSDYVDMARNIVTYSEIYERIDELTKYLDYCNICGLTSPLDHEVTLIISLTNINHLINRFITRNRPSLDIYDT